MLRRRARLSVAAINAAVGACTTDPSLGLEEVTWSSQPPPPTREDQGNDGIPSRTPPRSSCATRRLPLPMEALRSRTPPTAQTRADPRRLWCEEEKSSDQRSVTEEDATWASRVGAGVSGHPQTAPSAFPHQEQSDEDTEYHSAQSVVSDGDLSEDDNAAHRRTVPQPESELVDDSREQQPPKLGYFDQLRKFVGIPTSVQVDAVVDAATELRAASRDLRPGLQRVLNEEAPRISTAFETLASAAKDTTSAIKSVASLPRDCAEKLKAACAKAGETADDVLDKVLAALKKLYEALKGFIDRLKKPIEAGDACTLLCAALYFAGGVVLGVALWPLMLQIVKLVSAVLSTTMGKFSAALAITTAWFAPSKQSRPEHDGSELEAEAQAGPTPAGPAAVIAAVLALLTGINLTTAGEPVQKALISAAKVATATTVIGTVTLAATKEIFSALPRALQEFMFAVGLLEEPDYDHLDPDGVFTKLNVANRVITMDDMRADIYWKQDQAFLSNFRTVMGLAEEMYDTIMLSTTSPMRRFYYKGIMSAGRRNAIEVNRYLQPNSRVVPAAYYLSGASGIGKTTVSRALVSAVYASCDTDLELFSLNFQDRYLSGYTNQRVVYADDMPLASSEYRAMMALWIGSDAQRLNMADLADKGKKFTSELILATGNRPLNNLSAGQLPRGAWTRRWTAINVELNPEYADENGMLDPDLIPPNEAAVYPHLRFTLIQHNAVGEMVGRTILGGFGAVVELMRGDLASNAKNFERMKETLAEVQRQAAIVFGPDGELLAEHQGADSNKSLELFLNPVETLAPEAVQLLSQAALLDRPKEWPSAREHVVEFLTQELAVSEEQVVAQLRDMGALVDVARGTRSRADFRALFERLLRLPEFAVFVNKRTARMNSSNFLRPVVVASVGAGYQPRPTTEDPRGIFAALLRRMCPKWIRYEKLAKACQAIATALGLYVAGLGLASVWKSYTQPTAELQSNSTRRGLRERRGFRRPVTKRFFNPGRSDHRPLILRASAQGGFEPFASPQAAAVATGKLRAVGSIMCKLSSCLDGRFTQGFVIGQHVYTTNHFTDNLPSGSQLTMSVNGCTHGFRYESDTVERLPAVGNLPRDLVRWKLPFKPEVPHVKSRDFALEPMGQLTCVYRVSYGEDGPEYRRATNVEFRPGFSRWRADCPGYATNGMYLYDDGKKGDCGSLLVSLHPQLQILGMHVAGLPDVKNKPGIAVPIDIASFSEAQSSHTIVDRVVEFGPPKPLVSLSEFYEPVATLVKPEMGCPTKTRYVKSPIYDHPLVADVTDKPAQLGSGDATRSQLLIASLNSAAHVNPDLPEAHREVVTQAVGRELATMGKPFTAKTWEQVAGTVPELPGLKCIAMSTSAGLPFCKPGVKGKHGYIRVDEEGHHFTVDGFVEHLDAMEERFRHGAEPMLLHVGLKDELRKPHKATRNIAACGLDYTLMLRKHFGALISAVQTKGGVYAVGMNVLSRDWNDMISELSTYGDRGFDGDFKHMESLMTEQVAGWLADCCDHFYGLDHPDNALRRNLLCAIHKSHLVVAGQVVEQKHGNPSGIPGTTAFNCIVVDILLRCCWLKIFSGSYLASMRLYEQHLGRRIYGDDNLLVPSPVCSGAFNFLTVRAAMADMGATYTAADKVSEYETKPLVECEFLKCTTRVEPNAQAGVSFFSVPTRNSLVRSLKYVKNTYTPIVALVTNMNNALKRAHGLGEEDFNTFRDSLEEALASVGYEARLPMFSDLDALFYAGALHDSVESDIYDEFFPEHCVREVVDVTGEHLVVTRARVHGTLDDDEAFYKAEAQSGQDDDFNDISQVPDLEDPANVVAELAPVHTISGMLGTNDDDNHLSHILGRQGYKFLDVPYLLDTSEIFLSDDASVPLTPVGWFAAAYRFWSGSIVVTMYGPADLEASVAYLPERRGGAFHGVGYLGPTARVTEGGFLQMRLPFISQYSMLKVPKTSGDISQADVNSLRVNTRGQLSSVMWGGGDDFTLMCPFMVPDIIYLNNVVIPREGFLEAEAQSGYGASIAGQKTRKEAHEESTGPMEDGGDPAMSMAGMLARPNHLGTYVWEPSMAVSTRLMSVELPLSGFTAQTARNVLDSYALLNGRMLLTLTIQSTIFQQGLLIAYFVPLEGPNQAQRHRGAFSSSTLMKHVLIPAGGTTTIEFEVPYQHYLSHLRTGSSDSLGTFALEVFSPLRVGQFASGPEVEAKITVLFSMPDAGLAIIQGGQTFSKTHPVEPAVAYRTKPRPVVRKQAWLRVESQGGVVSTVGKVAKTTGNVANAIGGAIDHVSDEGGLRDKPNFGGNALQVVRRGGPHTTTGRDMDYAMTMALDPGRAHTHPDRVTATKDMDLVEVRQRYTYLERFVWSAGEPEGSVLHVMPLHPCPNAIRLSPGPQGTPSRFRCTFLEYSCLPFAFWRGSLRYKFVLVGAKPHTGRVAVVAHYFQRSSDVQSMAEAMSQYYTVCDLSQESPVAEVVIPYRSQREKQRIPQFSPVIGASDEYEHTLGELSIRVLNPLRTVESTEDFVEVLVFLSAGPDFRTDYLDHSINYRVSQYT